MLKKLHFVYLILAAAFLLSACIPTVSNGGTINATQAAELVENAVAEALSAQATQDAANQPAPTATLLPTETFTPAPTVTLIPTMTPLVLAPTATVAAGGGGGGGGGAVVTYPDACDPDIQKRPFDLTVMRKGDPFDIKFIIENTGTSTWAAGKDLVYYSGPDFTNGQFTTVQLPKMKPGDRFQVGPYDATAPNENGRHVMTFKLEGGFCWPYVLIEVK